MPSTLQRITLAFSLSYLAACAGGISLNGTPDAVDGRQPPTQNVNWYWLGGAGMMDQVIVNHPQNYILNTKSSSATIVADCNQGAADLDKTAEGRIWLEKFQISKNICPQGSQAQSFIAGLKDAAQSEVRGDMLRLHRRDYGSTMILSLDPKAELSLYRCPSSETMVVILSGNNAVVWLGEKFTRIQGPGGKQDRYQDDSMTLQLSANLASMLADSKTIQGPCRRVR